VIGNAAFTAEAQGIRVFTVSIPSRWRKSDAEALQYYFPERDFVPLMEVLATVNRHTGWMEEFRQSEIATVPEAAFSAILMLVDLASWL